MIIIIEGVDCSGKSTFASKLAEKTGFEVIKGSSFEISELGSDGMYNYMMELLDKKDIIIDRFLWSNLVYGLLYSYPMMLPEQYDALIDKLDRKAFVIYLHAPEGVIRYRMGERGDDMVRQDEISPILTEYKNVMYGYFRPKMMMSLDTSNSDFDIATAMMKDFISLDLTKIYINNNNNNA